jgi:hypothetical protein
LEKFMTSNVPRLLWLVVAYNNRREVASFVERVAQLNPDEFAWAICDNSPDEGAGIDVEPTSHVYVSRPDNPGYLEGALLGLEEWIAKGGDLPDWVVVSNTDLELVSGDPTVQLVAYDPAIPRVIAPRITEGEDFTEKNPHILHERSKERLRLNHWATATTGLAWVYLVGSQMKHRLRTWTVRRVSGASGTELGPTDMFAPYGAMMFMSRGFVESSALPRRVPLMTEEYFVGKAAAAAGARVTYEPKIHAHHVAHETTGGKVSRQRARAISLGFRAMARGLPQ